MVVAKQALDSQCSGKKDAPVLFAVAPLHCLNTIQVFNLLQRQKDAVATTPIPCTSSARRFGKNQAVLSLATVTRTPVTIPACLQTADKVAVEELDIPTDGDLTSAAVVAVVLPGSGRLTQDDVLSLPPKRLIKSSTQTLDGQVGRFGGNPWLIARGVGRCTPQKESQQNVRGRVGLSSTDLSILQQSALLYEIHHGTTIHHQPTGIPLPGVPLGDDHQIRLPNCEEELCSSCRKEREAVHHRCQVSMWHEMPLVAINKGQRMLCWPS